MVLIGGSMINITCCKSCGVGCSGETEEEIQIQREKYNGKYICNSCESTVNDIANGEFGKFKTWDNKKCLITNDGVYIDKGMKSRNEKYLGFGGRLFLIIETVQEGYLKKKKVYLTNDLFSIRSINKSLVTIYEHNINAEIINVDWDSFELIKTQLDKMK